MSHSGPTAENIYALYFQIRFGNWPYVFSQIYLNQDFAYTKDPIPSTLGWTLFDHATYQRRKDVLSELTQYVKSINQPYPENKDEWQKDFDVLTGEVDKTLIFSAHEGISQLLDHEHDSKFTPGPDWKVQPPIGTPRQAKGPR
jgi:hypothetical protein